jgi:hypothetical protein
VSPIVIQQDNDKSNVDDTNEIIPEEELTKYRINTKFDMKKPEKTFDDMFNDLKSNNECFLDELFNTHIVVN